MPLKGMPQHKMAEQLAVTAAQICYDLRIITAEWQKNTLSDIEAIKAIEIEKINKTEYEAWEAWERSKSDRQTTRTGTNNNGSYEETVTSTSCGDPRYLEVIMKCCNKRLEIFGALGKDAAGAANTGQVFVLRPLQNERDGH